MASEWQRVRLSEIIRVEHGWPFKSDLYSRDLSGKPIVVSVGNFDYSGGFRFESTDVKEYRGAYPRSYELTARDILLVMTCQTAGGEILGVPARVPKDGRIYLHNQRLGKVVITEPARVRPSFLYWLFHWKDFNSELVSSATGTKILHTSPERIVRFEFALPNLADQDAIAELFDAIESRIAIMRDANTALEALARTIFRSWFVDFDPVRAKAEGREPEGMDAATAALFPNGFNVTPLGEIPYFWGTTTLSNVVSVLQRGIAPRYVDKGILVLNQKCIRNGRVDTSLGRRHDLHKRVADDKLCRAGDVLVNSTGVGTLGRVAQLIELDEPTTVDSHVTIVRPNLSRIDAEYLGTMLTLRQDEIEALATGTTGQTELSRMALGTLTVTLPPPEVMSRYADVVHPINARIAQALKQSRNLSLLRDTLLPRLISGKLRVPKAQKLVEAVL